MARRKKTDVNATAAAKHVFIAIILIAVAIFTVKQTVFFFRNSEVFRVKEIVKSPSLQHVDSHDLDYAVGRNIFGIDLAGIQRRVQAQYPSVDNLRVVRQLPNRIYVMAEKREPFAVAVIARGEAVVDGYGVVLEDRPSAFRTLPVITGVSDVDAAVPGDRLRSRQTGMALKVLTTMAEHPYLNRVRVRSIDVSDLSKMLLVLENYGDIIMDRYQIEDKLDQLGILLSQPDLDLKDIAYIDLRFKAPIASKRK